jgi:uncharacterized repeat protein (TIGR01451 family)
MRPRILTVLVVAIAFLFVAQSAITTMNLGGFNSHFLSSSNDPSYSERLTVDITSSETFWRADLVGGNISVANVTAPAGVSGFSITLTHHDTWKNSFEVFTSHGFGLLGPFEPMPNSSILVINSTTASAASSLASSLSNRFGLAFEPYTYANPFANSSTTFVYISPMDFTTEVHLFFWKLVPKWYGGYANMIDEPTFESGDLGYYVLTWSSTGGYAISLGGLRATSAAPFALYSELGVTATSLNYSSFATSSTLNINVLGGFVSSANTTFKFVNDYSRFTSSYTNSSTSSYKIVPNVNATIDFSFPIILAYRTIPYPDLTPTPGKNVTATIVVKNISPTNTPSVTNLSFNDTWLYSYTSAFQLLSGQSTGGSDSNLSSGQSKTFAYTFKVNATSGIYNVTAAPVKYQFSSAGKTINGTAFLNSEIMYVGSSALSGYAGIEAVETFSGSSVSGAPFSVNVTVTNKANSTLGGGTATDVMVPGQSPFALAVDNSLTFNETASPSSLIQTNASVGFRVTWTDGAGTHHIFTNNMSAVFSFGSPGSPGMTVIKSYSLFSSRKQANVTIAIFNDGSNTLNNLTLSDSLPAGTSYVKAYNGTTLKVSGSSLAGNITSLAVGDNETFNFLVNFTSPSNNVVFLPAVVSAAWNGQVVAHYSQGFGVPLGVVASKSVSPTANFQGTNITETLSLVNNGNLPVFDVNLSSTGDSFATVIKSTPSYRSMLNTSQSMSATLVANLTGSPGTYNSSSATASFLFAGMNQTASSSVFQLTIYHLVEANLTTNSPKIEEGHQIVVTVTVYNPSNVTVSNVSYTDSLPSGLELTGSQSFSVGSVGPGQSVTHTYIVQTNQPFSYTIQGGNMTFVYRNQTIKGLTSPLTLNIADDIKLRYGVPVVIGIVLVLATLFYVRRLTAPKATRPQPRTR